MCKDFKQMLWYIPIIRTIPYEDGGHIISFGSACLSDTDHIELTRTTEVVRLLNCELATRSARLSEKLPPCYGERCTGKPFSRVRLITQLCLRELWLSCKQDTHNLIFACVRACVLCRSNSNAVSCFGFQTAGLLVFSFLIFLSSILCGIILSCKVNNEKLRVFWNVSLCSHV
jgi:hypothetical protein